MAIPKRIPDSRVREAITLWRGNVAAAASALGITSNNLRKRLELLGVDLAALRRTVPQAPPSPPPSTGGAPINTTARRNAPLRVLPAHEARLREAKYDLCARYRVETNESAILEQFIAEAFEPWLRAKLEAKA